MRHPIPSFVPRSTRTLGPLAVALALLGGCALQSPGGLGAPLACDTHTDSAVDRDCPIGEECEVEHGSSFCKPHGGGDDGV